MSGGTACKVEPSITEAFTVMNRIKFTQKQDETMNWEIQTGKLKKKTFCGPFLKGHELARFSSKTM